MNSSTQQARPDHPVHPLVVERWSPYAFADREVSAADLRSLFEAARWAASSYNEQPWRYIVAARTNRPEFDRLLACLVEGNREWARDVPVLAVGCTHLKFSRNGKPNGVAQHDLGAASAQLTLEATARGLCVHQMAGILPDKVRLQFGVPEAFQPLTALAIGYAADPKDLPDKFRERDTTPRTRNPLTSFVFEGRWGTPAPIVATS